MCMKCFPHICRCSKSMEEEKEGLLMYLESFNKILTKEEVDECKKRLKEIENESKRIIG